MHIKHIEYAQRYESSPPSWTLSISSKGIPIALLEVDDDGCHVANKIEAKVLPKVVLPNVELVSSVFLHQIKHGYEYGAFDRDIDRLHS